MIFRQPAFRWSGVRAKGVEAAAVLDALDEPAALCAVDGAVLASNEAWRSDFGPVRRPPAICGLFAVFSDARREGRAQGVVAAAQDQRVVTIASVGAAHFIVRIERDPAQSMPKLKRQ